MGKQALRRQARKAEFLKTHPRCAYCGDVSTTVDHCPARGLFPGRIWPEGYEFPACYNCNHDAGRDEQVLALLFRLELAEGRGPASQVEFQKAINGLRRNQPELLSELRRLSASKQKTWFRQAFGPDGDHMRYRGWGAATIGPLATAAINRSMLKLGKALFYKHVGRPFAGRMLIRHYSRFIEADEFFAGLSRFTPETVVPRRANRDLTDKFIYQINCNSTLGVLFTVVQFTPQFIFAFLITSDEAVAEFRRISPESDFSLFEHGMTDCRLKLG
jgi:hypothetical protein